MRNKINKKKISTVIDRTAKGRLLSLRFFKRYLFQTIFIIALIMMYISNKYDCKTGMEQIVRLKNELNIARTDMQEQRSTYMSIIRETSMQHIVDNLHLNLAVRERPPYIVKY